MQMSAESFDISNVMPQGIDFTMGDQSYFLIYNYRALKRLSDEYGSIGEAMDALTKKDKYDAVLNFLYAGLCDSYKITKQQIEEWIGPASVHKLHDLVFTAVILSYGKPKPKEEEEVTETGEAKGGITTT